MSDTLELARLGEPAALEVLLGELRPMIVRYCQARLGQAAAADDVAQEVCIALLSALPRYRDTGRPLRAFVFGIAAHKCVDAQRAAARQAAPTAQIPDRPDDGPGPEELAIAGADAARLWALLEQLPAQQREPLVLRALCGLSSEQAGELLGVSPVAVRVAQHRALARLRGMVAEQG